MTIATSMNAPNSGTDERAEEFVKAFSSFVNSRSTPEFEYAVELMSREHRTLQQQMTQVCLLWLEHLTSLEEHNGYDLRNEASVKLAKRLLSEVEKYDLRLPLI